MVKLLADKISEAANRPVIADYDIENNDTGIFEHRDHGSSDEESDNSREEDHKESQKAHYVPAVKSKIRNDARDMGHQYAGAKGSRQELFDNDNNQEAVSDGQSEELRESECESEQESAQESDAVSWRTDSEDEIISDREEEKEEEEESKKEPYGDEKVEEDSQLKRDRLARLVERETRQAVNRLSETTQRDAAKGLCIIEQSKLFDNILEVRMKLQKAITTANSLPLTKESWSHYEEQSPSTEKLLKKTSKLLEKILGQMVDFRKEFQISDHISQHKDSESKKKRSLKELTQETVSLDDKLKDYRSAVLNKWSVKVAAASGKSVLNATKFKAVNQPSDVQVENQLSDMDRLVKRTCLSRRSVTPLRFHEDLQSGKLSHLETFNSKEGQGADIEENIDIPKNYDPRRKDAGGLDTKENPYIFDDEDFYRVLLNDLVDKKILNAKNSQGGAATIAITSRSNNKLKKNIDTKASKGRKLNFSIQEDIANYEAPSDGGYKWSDEQIDEFFAGLLGQKVDFNENEKEQSDFDDAEEASAIKNDDIQIFG